ncbi:tetratricopeptide repeat protein, partial [Planktothrix sp.]|uniref:tetratricopeptide repeat protein n=1 Tax=Planktothrix sp. TaxID=3088171 RepID=UPI0038D3DAC6
NGVIEQLRGDLQTRKESTFNKLDKFDSMLTDQLTEVQADANTQKAAIFQELVAMQSDASARKDEILKELATISPTAFVESAVSEMMQKIGTLTEQLDRLKSNKPELFLEVEDFVQQGNVLFAEGRYEEALKAFNQVVELQPN